MKTLLEISYVGTNFNGFQVQPNGRTVQETLQDALERLYGMRPAVKGCSRTDSGVHALQFFATFESDGRIPCGRLPAALNSVLPPDISVRSAVEVPEDFHVRHDVLWKEYEYLILNDSIRDPFLVGRAWQIKRPLGENELERMRAAAEAFPGKHDFGAFMAAGSDIADTVRDMKWLKIIEDGKLIRIRAAADGFLYNMVRIIVGTLVDAGYGRISPEDMPDIISSRNRSRAGFTAPPDGLYLRHVEFSR